MNTPKEKKSNSIQKALKPNSNNNHYHYHNQNINHINNNETILKSKSNSKSNTMSNSKIKISYKSPMTFTNNKKNMSFLNISNPFKTEKYFNFFSNTPYDENFKQKNFFK
jgi:hypothetical protein